MRTYHELILLPTFMERYNYLKLFGSVGDDKFGYDRYLNQSFYSSREWKNFRNHIIARDLGNDMALDGYAIMGKVLIHHLNPLVEKLPHGLITRTPNDTCPWRC